MTTMNLVRRFPWKGWTARRGKLAKVYSRAFRKPLVMAINGNIE
jgi:hypothetical protein